eukprot:TRINITY_DN72416_c0_g1_i1.p1 TRINITY_DN72416_c0_g1~~TRINITY_DN72416_c0_g1_i1.p1  ORF type:complete len:183 (-),score=14.56 TRINITY_DN72416_c0_g1_i1:131-640(-)
MQVLRRLLTFSQGGPFHRWPPPGLEFALAGQPTCGSRQAAALATALAVRDAAAANAVNVLGSAISRGGMAVAGLAESATAELFGWNTLFKKSRKMRGVHGTFNPSIWRYYHRHGYWATRRKMIDFGTKRKYRYNQVEGAGKRDARYGKRFCQFWMDKSYYKPFKNYCRF